MSAGNHMFTPRNYGTYKRNMGVYERNMGT